MSDVKKPKPPRWTTALVVLLTVPFAVCFTAMAVYSIAQLVDDSLRHGRYADEFFVSGIFAFLYSGLLLIAAVLVRESRLRWFAIAAIAPAVIGFLVAMVLIGTLIWREPHYAVSRTDEYMGLAAAVITLLGLGLMHNAGATCFFIRSAGLRRARVGLCIAIWGAILPLTSAIIFAIFIDSPWPMAVFGLPALLLGLLLLIATSAMPGLIRRSNARWEAARETISEKSELAFTCPTCQAAQRLRSGRRACSSCGQNLFIEIEEPRCDCGYLLYQLQSMTCPECGRDVPEEYSRLLETHSPGLAPGQEAEEERVPAPQDVQESAPSEDAGHKNVNS